MASVYYGVLLSEEEVSSILSYVEKNIHEVASWSSTPPSDFLLQYYKFNEHTNSYYVSSVGEAITYWFCKVEKEAVFVAEKNNSEALSFGVPEYGLPAYFGIYIGDSSELVLEGFKKKLKVSEKNKNDWKSIYKILKKFGIKNKRPKVYAHSYRNA